MGIPLPYVVAPKVQSKIVNIGDDECGVIAIERKGYLSVGEKGAFQQVETNKNGQTLLLKLVAKIEVETGLQRDGIVQSLSKIGDGDELPEYLSPYVSEIIEVLSAFDQDTSHTALIKAFVLLVSRVDPEYVIEDILKLHPSLINHLAALFDAEEARSLEALPSEYTELAVEEREAEDKSGNSSVGKRMIEASKGKKKAQS